MASSHFGRPLKRNEDPRLLTGQALFTDDVSLPEMAHAAFLRSSHAHARLLGVDVSEARTRPGVIAVFTAADLGDVNQPAPLVVHPPPVERLTFVERTHRPLATSKVRPVGEPIAMVVAETRYQAEDALAAIRVDYEPLGVVLDLEEALAAGAPLVHDDTTSNLAAHVVQEKGRYETARPRADVVIARRLVYDRGAAAPIENRAVAASWDALSRRMSVWDTTQSPIPVRNALARLLDLNENHVHVIAPFIGGAFGSKLLVYYPEEVLVPWASLRLGRPVKWTEDRLENFYGTAQERGQVHDAEIALARDGRILGVKDRFLHDTGAYDPYGLTVPLNSQCTLLGTYDIPNYYSEFRAVFTNRTIATVYRGAGRQHGVFVIERLLDLAARELGLDRAEIRRRNLIASGAFPYQNDIIYQDFAPLVYDSGNYAPVLDRALEMIGYERFVREEQPRLRAAGRRVGIGVVSHVEGTGIGPYEGARVQVMPSGRVSVVTGVGTQGQGHFTSFAQLAADALGVDVGDVEVVTGDTDQFHWGTGTFASRGAVVAGNAVHQAAREVRARILALAAEELGVPESALELAGGRVSVRSEPARGILIGALARSANPSRGAVRPGTKPGLEATSYYGPDRGATACGVHAMIAEVDPETMDARILKYVVVHDCGRMINPLIVEGQIHGGVAQGIGNAFYEQLCYDERGHIRNASLREFLQPTATDVPRIETGHLETPSPLNELGVKGAGEAGAIPVAPLFAQTLEDALHDPGLEILEIPLNPSRLWELARRRRT